MIDINLFIKRQGAGSTRDATCCYCAFTGMCPVAGRTSTFKCIGANYYTADTPEAEVELMRYKAIIRLGLKA